LKGGGLAGMPIKKAGDADPLKSITYAFVENLSGAAMVPCMVRHGVAVLLQFCA
jgi:hypothetical protein